MYRLLIIAGLDPSGKAGILLDVRVASRLNVHPIAIPVALTFQSLKSTKGFEPVDLGSIETMFSEASVDGADAIKIGMLGTKNIARFVKNIIRLKNCPVVLDPVLYAGDGSPLSDPELVDEIRKIIPFCTVITPNIPEASVLCDVKISSRDFYEKCRSEFVKMGAKNILIKGGHGKGNLAIDYLFSEKAKRVFARKRIRTNIRGTGCALSTAIASFIAKGIPVISAVARAEKQMTKWLVSAIDIDGQKILSI